MLKEATYKEKFELLKDWMPLIAETIKREIKNEHLKKDWLFVKKYFSGKNLNKITADELAEGYILSLREEEKAEEIAEFMSNCWLLKHGELYNFFETALKKVNPDFSAIELLEPKDSKEIAENAAKEFGAYNTYVFAVLNSVVFQENDLKELKAKADKELTMRQEEESSLEMSKSVEEAEKNFALKIARITDKYEKKIAGLQKKYNMDVAALKKQIASLQSKTKIS